jgi:hypothetical protein
MTISVQKLYNFQATLAKSPTSVTTATRSPAPKLITRAQGASPPPRITRAETLDRQEHACPDRRTPTRGDRRTVPKEVQFFLRRIVICFELYVR